MNKQFFTEQGTKVLKEKSAMAKTDLLNAVTTVDKYGIDWNDAGKTLLAW